MKSLLFIALTIIEACSASKILVLFPTSSRSQVIITQELSLELVRRGHEVTTVSLFPLNKAVPNYRDIKISYDDRSQYKGDFKNYLSFNPTTTLIF
jgi:hypothetical protein